jgi:hypothetical protein
MSGHSKWEPGRRGALIRHLHRHPDHARRWPAGHDFVLISTSEIEHTHEKLHAGLLSLTHRHSPGSQLQVQGEKEEMSKEALDLKVTVTCPDADPDTVLARMDKGRMRLMATDTDTVHSLKVSSAERADGLPFGLEAAFKEYWSLAHPAELRLDGSEAQDEAKKAFMAAAKKFGKRD